MVARPSARSSATPTHASGRGSVLLLANPLGYRAAAFTEAAARLGLPVLPAFDLPDALDNRWGATLPLDFGKPDEAVARIVAHAADHPITAVLSLDDSASLIAAKASAALGFPHNDPAAAEAARDKLKMRRAFAAGGVPVPAFRGFRLDADPATLAREMGPVGFPCVVKPTMLNGSRGVIRANDPVELAAAFARTRDLLLTEAVAQGTEGIVVEGYLPGVEVALEGLLTDGALTVLALFDKPDPLEGPYFEETIYVTPSRLPESVQREIAAMTEQAAAAVGVRHGPIHAELRINDDGVWPIELAGRSIGGLCSTILEFGTGMSLEELILAHAVGGLDPVGGPDAGASADDLRSRRSAGAVERRGGASGVIMIPIPRRGVLKAVEGREEALVVPGITGLEITAKLNYPIVPLPEGASYLGFIFARAETPAEVEAALRTAHAALDIRIDPMLTMRPVG